MKRILRFERVYPHPIEAVWDALTDPAALAEWLMENNFAPYVGHRFQFRTKASWGFDGVVNCEVLAVEKPRRLVYTWQGGPMRRPTTITWLLEPTADGAGTRLHLHHDGFEGAVGVALSVLLGSGWGGILRERLPVFIERRQRQAQQ